MNTANFTSKDISLFFGRLTNDVARMIPAVTNIAWQGGILSGALVEKGSLYKARALFEPSTGEFRTGCTCDVFGCDHTVALLYASLHVGTRRAGLNLDGWLDSLSVEVNRVAKEGGITAKSQKLVYYLGQFDRSSSQFQLLLLKSNVGKNGLIDALGDHWDNIDRALENPPQFLTQDDLSILRLIKGTKNTSYGFVIEGGHGAAILEKAVGTGRFVFRSDDGWMHLVKGATRLATLSWEKVEGGAVRPVLMSDMAEEVFVPTSPIWYICAETYEAGVISTGLNAEIVKRFLEIDHIPESMIPQLSERLRSLSDYLPLPSSAWSDELPVIRAEPVPIITLYTGGRFDPRTGDLIRYHFAKVAFDYSGVLVQAESHLDIVVDTTGASVKVARDRDAEMKRLTELKTRGFTRLVRAQMLGPTPAPVGALVLYSAKAWNVFMHQGRQTLADRGWRVEMDPDFDLNVTQIDEIKADLRQIDGDWLELELGIEVGDETVRLEPLLAAVFSIDPRWIDGRLNSISDSEMVEVRTPSGDRVRFKAERLKPVVRNFIDLLVARDSDKIRVSRYDAGRIQAAEDTGRIQFHGEEAIKALAERLRGGDGVRLVAPPKGLKATLRDYQLYGLSWLQFLREYGLAGCLGDDMGLGKTIQTIAHLLLEKEAGRLKEPALVILPYSLVHNWQNELAAFAPDLRVLTMSGASRTSSFEKIPEYDVVLTTYSLLWRDQDKLSKNLYSYVIPDEAQNLKNANSEASKAIRKIKSRNRIALTGTPLENHLGELWSLYDFLMPGFLGSSRDFNQRWRKPIEKGSDSIRGELLSRRIKPFMLRRKKQDVVKELPPKTIVVEMIDIAGAQRDLYETVRATVNEDVQMAIAAKGASGSQIDILTALLKLRQVCCHPKLLKLDDAALVEESAKMEALMSKIPELVAEGRKILVFSAFAEMISLISDALNDVGIGHATITGKTKNRSQAIDQFQFGAVPVLLVTLKAGGVGLNLTAADVVIMFDPWWNPAAENQAIDRAHRIGQEKAVFVYKLIVAGSLEEKILGLQAKKAELAESIVSDDGSHAAKFTDEDIASLFEPLPEMPDSEDAE